MSLNGICSSPYFQKKKGLKAFFLKNVEMEGLVTDNCSPSLAISATPPQGNTLLGVASFRHSIPHANTSMVFAHLHIFKRKKAFKPFF